MSYPDTIGVVKYGKTTYANVDDLIMAFVDWKSRWTDEFLETNKPQTRGAIEGINQVIDQLGNLGK